MRVEQHESVRAELREAISWYESQRDGLGVEFMAAVRAGLRVIRRSPQTWPCPSGTDDASIHHYFLGRFPYRLVYFFDPSVIVLVAVAHLSRHPFYWRQRLPGNRR